jgi:hypothetical protein
VEIIDIIVPWIIVLITLVFCALAVFQDARVVSQYSKASLGARLGQLTSFASMQQIRGETMETEKASSCRSW